VKRLGVNGLHLKSSLGNPPEKTSKRENAIEQTVVPSILRTNCG
jgi:hypothetical protein